jgi:hypothetical protein
VGECLEARGWTEVSLAQGMQVVLARPPARGWSAPEPVPSSGVTVPERLPQVTSLRMSRILSALRARPDVPVKIPRATLIAMERRGLIMDGPTHVILSPLGERLADTLVPAPQVPGVEPMAIPDDVTASMATTLRWMRQHPNVAHPARSGVLHGLERRGYLEAGPADGRARYVLTDLGRRLADALIALREKP